MKKILTAILTLTLALCLSCGALATVLRPGDRGTAVIALQTKLNQLGYADLRIDGVYGKSTTDAVTRYQLTHGLKADGKAGPRTLLKMFGTSNLDNNPSPDGRLRVGSTGSAVRQVQNLLVSLGYSLGRVDGTFGAKTKAAVMQFQAANGLRADGIVGSDTLAKLQSPSAIKYTKPVTYTKLKLGDFGNGVSRLQTRLGALGFYSGPVSGYYNVITEEAVINFQRAVGLKADGIAGQKTQWALYGGK